MTKYIHGLLEDALWADGQRGGVTRVRPDWIINALAAGDKDELALIAPWEALPPLSVSLSRSVAHSLCRSLAHPSPSVYPRTPPPGSLFPSFRVTQTGVRGLRYLTNTRRM